MILLIVNHHYISERREADPRVIYPVTVAELQKELEILGREFDFVSRDTLLAALDGGPALPARSCLLTFDDGLREQFEVALPILDQAGVPALFFVSGRPLAERRALNVHKLHAVRERVSDDELVALLGIDENRDATPAAAVYPYDTKAVATLKYALNFATNFDQSEAALDPVFARVVGADAQFCAELYMDDRQVRELETRGALGSHSYSHRPLALLGDDEARIDLERGAAALTSVTGVRPRTLGYPYGSVSAGIAEQAARVGFAAAFTIERAFNRSLDAALLLARFDVTDLPGGSHACFSAVDGQLVLDTESR